jgi:erythromycin esterase-like protein
MAHRLDMFHLDRGASAIRLLRTLKPLIAAACLTGAAACGGGSPSAQTAQPQAQADPTPTPPTTAARWTRDAVPLAGEEADYNRMLAAIGDARFVLLGESTHGTEEYYRERARLSERLVRERGFGAIAIEGDWSSTWRVNLYVRGLGADTNAAQALQGYEDFPEWMWPNTAFRDFIERLRAYNLSQPAERRVGVYGMDVYDLFDAADYVVAYLRQADPAAARRAQAQYRCFANYGRDNQAYGEASRRASASCQQEAEAVMAEVGRIPRPAGTEAAERHFALVRSAASVVAAEEYFRTAYAGSMAWNVRDQRMARNVEAIAQHVAALSGREGKVAAWSHNTHSGDARATFAAERGELNLGQLMRQRHGQDAFLIGFLTHRGTVFAAPSWGGQGRVYDLRPALRGSYADVLSGAAMPAFSLVLRGNAEAVREIGEERLERAVGVIYAPATERESHYFEARIGDQFDAIIFIERTRAVTPLG